LTRVVDLPDDDPKVVEDVLHHLYTGHYRLASIAARVCPSLEHLLRHVGIYVLADKWGMQPLKRLALDQFLEDGTECEDGITLIMAADEIYLRSSEKDDLRLAAVSLVRRHLDDFPLSAQDEEHLNEIPGLGSDLLAWHMNPEPESLEFRRCGDCDTLGEQLIEGSYWCPECEKAFL